MMSCSQVLLADIWSMLSMESLLHHVNFSHYYGNLGVLLLRGLSLALSISLFCLEVMKWENSN